MAERNAKLSLLRLLPENTNPQGASAVVGCRDHG